MPYFTIDTGRGTLKVYNDGTIRETRNLKEFQRRLSAGQLRKLNKILAARPCREQPEYSSIIFKDGKPTLIYLPPKILGPECSISWAGAGIGLVEVKVTLFSPNIQNEGYPQNIQKPPFPVYFPCSNLTGRQKDRTSEIHRQYLSQNWQRFLRGLSKASGANKLLEDLDCPSGWVSRK